MLPFGMLETATLLLQFEKEWYEQRAKEDETSGLYDMPLPMPSLNDLLVWLKEKVDEGLPART